MSDHTHRAKLGYDEEARVWWVQTAMEMARGVEISGKTYRLEPKLVTVERHDFPPALTQTEALLRAIDYLRSKGRRWELSMEIS